MPKTKTLWLSLGSTILAGSGLVLMILLSLSLGAGALGAAPAGTWYVNDATGNDGNDCMSPGTACKSIGAAVAKASDDDTIQIAAGLYLENDIEVFKRLTFLGAGADSTILDGNHAGRVLRVSADSTISDVTIRHGQLVTTSTNIFDKGGGAILNLGGLTIRDSILVDNYVEGTGGAIFNNGDLVIENSEILSNTSETIGGGIYNYSAGTISITASLLAHNTAAGTQGGAIYAPQPLYLHDVTVRDNSAGSFGGGLVTSGESVLEGVTLTGNQAASGAAYFAQNGGITMTNVTVSDNTASNNYGGIYISGPGTSLYLQNGTIAYNKRTSAVGTGFNGLNIGNNASASIVNTIFSDNDDKNCGGTAGNWTSLGYNLSSDSSCAFTQTGDQQAVDPLLGPLADYGGETLTHALLPGSPAIDAGTNSACPATDQRGVSRPYDGDNDSTATCDVGAYEAQHQIIIEDATVTEGNSGTVNAVFTVTLAPENNLTVTVDYATADDTAIAGSDYTAVSGTLTLNPGETQETITVLVTGDTADESDETFDLLLSNAANAEIVDAEASGTIVDDDGLAALTIADQAILEGDSGTVDMLFEVNLSPAISDVVTVDYATTDGTAAAGEDYVVVSDTLTFNPGETSKEITVQVQGDVYDEGVSEAFSVQLSGATNANIVDGEAEGTITDDDTARLSHHRGPDVFEGNSGLTPATFTVTLSTPAAFTVTVDYEVSSGFGDDGAKIGSDIAITDTTGTLTFEPGATLKNYTIYIIGDVQSEEDEAYGSLISNANVTITVNGSIAYVLNDDDFFIFIPAVGLTP